MTTKEFFEQNIGKYFKIKDNYSFEIARVVGYNKYSILVSKSKGWKRDTSLNQGISYIDESLINKEDKLWFTHIECLTPIEQPELDLCKLLEGCEGKTFYSAAYGYVKLLKVNKEYKTLVFQTSTGLGILYNYDGQLSLSESECTLFPSKENRDWSTFEKPNKIKDGTPVMCYNAINGLWILRKYYNDFPVYKYIVPATEFDFSDFDSNKSKSII